MMNYSEISILQFEFTLNLIQVQIQNLMNKVSQFYVLYRLNWLFFLIIAYIMHTFQTLSIQIDFKVKANFIGYTI